MIPSSQHEFQKRSGQRAFTLIELLVVITIIGVLSAIALPVFNSVRTKSVQLKCSANLKQWGAAMMAYASDHNGGIRWRDWASIGDEGRVYEPYFANIAVASRDTRSVLLKGKGTWYTEVFRYCPDQKWSAGNAPVGYSVCRPSPAVSNSNEFPLSRADSLSNLLLMIDADTSDSAAFNMTGTDGLTSYVKPLTQTGTKLRHGGLINAMFCDGHIQGYRWAELDPNVQNNPGQVARLQKWFQLYGQ